jgi:hypothetical protein
VCCDEDLKVRAHETAEHLFAISTPYFSTARAQPFFGFVAQEHFGEDDPVGTGHHC